jgi:hypothetical protein
MMIGLLIWFTVSIVVGIFVGQFIKAGKGGDNG